MAGVDESRVSTLELFFDLVFVFTITQLTTLIVHEPGWRGVGQAVLALVVIWWMYGGYAWLTNHIGVAGLRRQMLLLGGMAGFLLMALSLPTAFGGSGTVFGIGYVLVIAIHAGLFLRASGGAARPFVAVARFNFAGAALVLAGGIAGGTAQYFLWGAAIVVLWGITRRTSDEGFVIAPSHFVERHGLVVIVAIGESVVAVGFGASGHNVGGRLVAASLLVLAISALLWWTYFGGDDARAERAMRAADPAARPRLALDGYGIWHMPILFGIVLVASGEKEATVHPFGELATAPALELALGATVFLIGEAMFRRTLTIARPLTRLGAAVLAAATIPLGLEVAATAELAALVVLLGGMLLVEWLADAERSLA
jgi:low temperature requirement protein LtrA